MFFPNAKITQISDSVMKKQQKCLFATFLLIFSSFFCKNIWNYHFYVLFLHH